MEANVALTLSAIRNREQIESDAAYARHLSRVDAADARGEHPAYGHEWEPHPEAEEEGEEGEEEEDQEPEEEEEESSCDSHELSSSSRRF